MTDYLRTQIDHDYVATLAQARLDRFGAADLLASIELEEECQTASVQKEIDIFSGIVALVEKEDFGKDMDRLQLAFRRGQTLAVDSLDIMASRLSVDPEGWRERYLGGSDTTGLEIPEDMTVEQLIRVIAIGLKDEGTRAWERLEKAYQLLLDAFASHNGMAASLEEYEMLRSGFAFALMKGRTAIGAEAFEAQKHTMVEELHQPGAPDVLAGEIEVFLQGGQET